MHVKWVSSKPFSLSQCLWTVVRHWGNVAQYTPEVEVSRQEVSARRALCREVPVPVWRLLGTQFPEAGSSRRFPKDRMNFGFLVLLRTSLFWVSFSSFSLFSWVHIEDHVCLLDCIVVDLQDMDIFAAERRPREYSKASDDSSGDLVFPSYFVRQTGGSLLTEPCRLKLQVERNLDRWVFYIWITITSRMLIRRKSVLLGKCERWSMFAYFFM